MPWHREKDCVVPNLNIIEFGICGVRKRIISFLLGNFDLLNCFNVIMQLSNVRINSFSSICVGGEPSAEPS